MANGDGASGLTGGWKTFANVSAVSLFLVMYAVNEMKLKPEAEREKQAQLAALVQGFRTDQAQLVKEFRAEQVETRQQADKLINALQVLTGEVRSLNRKAKDWEP